MHQLIPLAGDDLVHGAHTELVTQPVVHPGGQQGLGTELVTTG